MKHKPIRFFVVMALLLAFILQGCQPGSGPAATATATAQPQQTASSPISTPGETAKDLFTAFLAKQQLGATGIKSIPYTFETPYDDGQPMVMPGPVVLEDAVYSAQIADWDADGELELLVIRSSAVSDADYPDESYEALHADIYEQKDGQVTLAATAQLGTNAVAASASRGYADVFFAQAEKGWYIGLDAFNMAHYYADGICWEILLYQYDGTALQKIYDNYWMGSDFFSDYEDINNNFEDLMTLKLFPEGMQPYLTGQGDDISFNHHRITVEGKDIHTLFKLESWDVYGGRFLFDQYLGVQISEDDHWQAFIDIVEESEKKNTILLQDDLFLISDESELSQYIGLESRMTAAE